MSQNPVLLDPILVVAREKEREQETYAIWQVETDPEVQIGDLSGAWLVTPEGIQGFAAEADWIEGTENPKQMLRTILRYPVLVAPQDPASLLDPAASVASQDPAAAADPAASVASQDPAASVADSSLADELHALGAQLIDWPATEAAANQAIDQAKVDFKTYVIAGHASKQAPKQPSWGRFTPLAELLAAENQPIRAQHLEQETWRRAVERALSTARALKAWIARWNEFDKLRVRRLGGAVQLHSELTGCRYSKGMNSVRNVRTLGMTSARGAGVGGAGSVGSAPVFPRSFVLSVSHTFQSVQPASSRATFGRVLSVHSGISVAEMSDAILAAFRWPVRIDGVATRPAGHTTRDWTLRTRREGVVRTYGQGAHSIGTDLATALAPGALGVLKVGDFDFTITVAQAFTTEELPALIQGGNVPGLAEVSPHTSMGIDVPEITLLAADSLSHTDAKTTHPIGIPAEIDIADVNIELAGSDGVEDTLHNVNPELGALLRGSSRAMMEFLPLLQALDLGREADVDPDIAELLADAPEETNEKGRAAAWARIIALSTLLSTSEVDRVSEEFMAAVGWDLASSEIKEKARWTQRILATAGADEWHARPGDSARPLVPKRSVVQRLEMYRYLLQR